MLCKAKKLQEPVQFGTAKEGAPPTMADSHVCLPVTFKHKNKRDKITAKLCLLVADISQDIIIGRIDMDELNMSLNLRTGKCVFNSHRTRDKRKFAMSMLRPSDWKGYRTHHVNRMMSTTKNLIDELEASNIPDWDEPEFKERHAHMVATKHELLFSDNMSDKGMKTSPADFHLKEKYRGTTSYRPMRRRSAPEDDWIEHETQRLYSRGKTTHNLCRFADSP